MKTREGESTSLSDSAHLIPLTLSSTPTLSSLHDYSTQNTVGGSLFNSDMIRFLLDLFLLSEGCTIEYRVGVYVFGSRIRDREGRQREKDETKDARETSQISLWIGDRQCELTREWDDRDRRESMWNEESIAVRNDRYYIRKETSITDWKRAGLNESQWDNRIFINGRTECL